MNFPRLTVDDVKAIRSYLLAYATFAEKADKLAAKQARMLADRLMEIA